MEMPHRKILRPLVILRWFERGGISRSTRKKRNQQKHKEEEEEVMAREGKTILSAFTARDVSYTCSQAKRLTRLECLGPAPRELKHKAEHAVSSIRSGSGAENFLLISTCNKRSRRKRTPRAPCGRELLHVDAPPVAARMPTNLICKTSDSQVLPAASHVRTWGAEAPERGIGSRLLRVFFEEEELAQSVVRLMSRQVRDPVVQQVEHVRLRPRPPAKQRKPMHLIRHSDDSGGLVLSLGFANTVKCTSSVECKIAGLRESMRL
eukprot:766248-Hanusia_phi.AAC.3